MRVVYQRRRAAFLRSGDWLPRLGKHLFHAALRLCDFVLDLTEDGEMLDERRRHPAYWWDKRPIDKTERAHRDAVIWKEKWISDHRNDSSLEF